VAGGDIGARGFCSYELVLSELMRAMGMKGELTRRKSEAHRWFCRLVKFGELGLKSRPDVLPDFDPDYYDGSPGPISIGIDDSINVSAWRPPPFTLEEYSIGDLRQLVDQQIHSQPVERSINWEQLEAFPGDMDLVEQIDRMVNSGEARSVRAASKRLAPRAAGPATEDSKARRLANLHKSWKVMNS
jgi:hypothetical protein